MSAESRTNSVHIHGHEYKVRSTENADFVRDVALYVDEVMHGISSRMTTGTTSRVAVLAALNIAEELFRERRNGGATPPDQVEERLRAVLGRLEEIAGAAREKRAAPSS